MIDLKYLRKNPDVIKKSLEKRKDYNKIEWVDEIIELDRKEREYKNRIDELRHKRNVISKDINVKKKKGEDITDLIKEVKDIPNQIKDLEDEWTLIKKRITHLLMRIPNILDNTVPYGESDEDNIVINKWGKPRTDKVKTHSDWIIENDYADLEKAAKIAGARSYFLKDKLLKLQRALMDYTMDVLEKHGFNLITVPYMVHEKVVGAATDLSDFDDVIYKIENEDLCLIPTSEHVFVGMHMNDKIDVNELPLKYAGYSCCFRKEAGTHGKDTKGIFRVHQFNKVEMFVYSKPEDSSKIFDQMIEIQKEIVQSLELPYQMVNVCTGDLGIVAAKKYDIEVWMPASQKYREVTSCSNCTAYQSVRGNIKMSNKEYAHTLNGTGLPDTRTLVAIIENNMQDNGKVKVPKVLHKYLNFTEL